MPHDDGISYHGKDRKLSDYEEPFLKANTKLHNVMEDPKRSKDMMHIDTIHMSIESDNRSKSTSPYSKTTGAKVKNKLRNNIMNMKSKEFYTPLTKLESYKKNFELCMSQKPSLMSRDFKQHTLTLSESADAKNFLKNYDIDYPYKNSQRAMHTKPSDASSM